MKPPSLIGQPADRVDGRAKVTGAASYAADIPVAKLAHAVIVTSGISHGRILAIEAAAASKMPGVLAVLTHANAPHVHEPASHGGPSERVLQLLQNDRILYGDQPIAVAIADTLEHAQAAALAVTARYHADHAVADLVASLGAARSPQKPPPSGPTDSARGDVAAALAQAAHKLDLVYTTPVQNHNPMEPHATTAVWQGADRLTVYDSTQHVYGVRQRLAELFALPPQNVRVIDPFVGGAFGCKGTAWSHVALAAMAAKHVGRPVKLVVTRTQMFSLVGHRPKTVQTIAIGCDARGQLVGLRHDVVSETSSFDEFTEPAAIQTRMLYACPNVATSHRIVAIDVPTPTFQRAPGESTGTYALEAAMDELAYAANLDPLELRRRNYTERDPEDNKPFSSKSLHECYEKAADKFGWAKRSPKPRTMRDGKELVGYGMATATYPARQLPSVHVRVTVRAEGSALVQCASHDLGTGTYTVMSQIAADTLGIPLSKVTFELGDTALPEAPLSAGSMTAATVGPGVYLACLDAKAKAQAAPGQDITVEHESKPRPERQQYSCHAFGADFVEVRVDEELGTARVARMVAAFGCGRILNAKLAASQLMGGMVWALGFALEEHTVRDRRTARAVSRDLVDYHLPVNADVPPIDIILVDEVDPHVNEIGVKGLGEIGVTGAVAAIANAIFHATGKRIRDLPITLDKLL